MELNLTDILEVVEEIQRRWLDSCLSLGERLKSRGSLETCARLAAYRRSRVRRVERALVQARSRPESGGLLVDRFPKSNVRAMASLAFFARGQQPGKREYRPATSKEILRHAAGRSRDAVVFYEGLKAFTQDRGAHIVLDRLAETERRHGSLALRAAGRRSGESASNPDRHRETS
jgi:hypothetical protein